MRREGCLSSILEVAEGGCSSEVAAERVEVVLIDWRRAFVDSSRATTLRSSRLSSDEVGGIESEDRARRCCRVRRVG